MTETAKHETLETDPSSDALENLEKLDLAALSFIQLRRLHNALKQVSNEVDQETQRRAAEDSAGDTVRVPSPKM